MLYQQNYFNINIEYYENLIKIDIFEKHKYNIKKFEIYKYVLDIFKLNKTEMIIKIF